MAFFRKFKFILAGNIASDSRRQRRQFIIAAPKSNSSCRKQKKIPTKNEDNF